MAELLFFDWPPGIDLIVIQALVMVAAVCAGIWMVDGLRARRVARSRAPDSKGPQPARPPAE